MLKSNSSAVLFAALATTVIVGLAGCSEGVTAEGAAQVDAGGESSRPTPSVRQTSATQPTLPAESEKTDGTADAPTRELVLAGGCFWCMEAGFEQLRGVRDVTSGYAGGPAESASYRTVAAGLTPHAEAIRITYNPHLISEELLLKVFFVAAHDPTQVNRQGPDVGRQYRSAVFYTSEEQKLLVRRMVAELNASGRFDRKIATTLEPLEGFYPAEDYHQDYARLNPDQPYVVVHSQPSAARVCQIFPELVRQIEEFENSTPDSDSADSDPDDNAAQDLARPADAVAP